MENSTNINNKDNAKLILSTDTLNGYGLDLIFQTVKETGFSGIDLSLWKNFDAWNVSYVKKLVDKYKISINIIQLSSNVNSKEMNHAIDLAKYVNTEVISINAPEIMNYKSYKFLTENIGSYRKLNPELRFCIINPEKSSLFMLPIPKFYFSNLVDIIKKYKFYLGLDIVNMDEQTLETSFIKKISTFLSYIPVIYLADKSHNGLEHCQLGEGTLKLGSLLKLLKQNNFSKFFSLKINLLKKDLSDMEKLENILKKSINYYNKYFGDLQF